MTGGNVPAGGSCTFTIDITTSNNTPSGTFTNTTSSLSGTVDGIMVNTNPATADLTILAMPNLTKSFTNDPVLPGDIVDLEFTIIYPMEAQRRDRWNGSSRLAHE